MSKTGGAGAATGAGGDRTGYKPEATSSTDKRRIEKDEEDARATADGKQWAQFVTAQMEREAKALKAK